MKRRTGIMKNRLKYKEKIKISKVNQENFHTQGISMLATKKLYK